MIETSPAEGYLKNHKVYTAEISQDGSMKGDTIYEAAAGQLTSDPLSAAGIACLMVLAGIIKFHRQRRRRKRHLEE